MSQGPQTLDRAGIEALIPHRGDMCLLTKLEGWDAQRIHCSTTTHRDPANPLRTATGLLAPNAIEYAAQAMALHGGLTASAGQAPSAGYLASVRSVRFGAGRLDQVEGVLQVRATRLSGDERQVLYEFDVTDTAGHSLAQGRAVVVLNTPLTSMEVSA